ncbi:hypothetical protein SLE2022_324330 [Rubroshorea leprosula]
MCLCHYIYTPQGLGYIASAIWVPVSLDKATEQLAQLKFSQIFVEVDLDKAHVLPESASVDLDDESVEVLFEYPLLKSN